MCVDKLKLVVFLHIEVSMTPKRRTVCWLLKESLTLFSYGLVSCHCSHHRLLVHYISCKGPRYPGSLSIIIPQ